MRHSLILVLSCLQLAAAQGYIHHIAGVNNITASGFLVNSTQAVPGGPEAGEANVTVVLMNSTQGCGSVLADGVDVDVDVDVDTGKELDRAAVAGLPMADANGTISMLWRQVGAGAGGAGPAAVEWDRTGTGTNFTPIAVLVNIGDGGADSDQILTVQLPEYANCTSGELDNACLLRVTAGSGPYGSCLAVASYNSSAFASADSGEVTDSDSGSGPGSSDTAGAGGEGEDDDPTPTIPNGSRPSPSRVISGGASLPSSMKKRTSAAHGRGKKGSTKAWRGAHGQSRVGSAWSRAKRWGARDAWKWTAGR